MTSSSSFEVLLPLILPQIDQISCSLYSIKWQQHKTSVQYPLFIRPNFPAWTVDYLLRLICDFWKTGGEHPAFRRVEDEAETESEEKDRRFRLYVRVCEVEVKELKTRYLDQLEKTRSVNIPKSVRYSMVVKHSPNCSNSCAERDL